jgi:hypothetical protein
LFSPKKRGGNPSGGGGIKVGMNRKRESSNMFHSPPRKAGGRNLNAKCFYMYNRDKTILYYYSANYKELINSLNIHYVTFEKHLNKATYYLGKYLFTREFEQSALFKQMSLSEVALMLQKDREKFLRKKD